MWGQGQSIQECSIQLFGLCCLRRAFALCLLFFSMLFVTSLSAQTTSTITGSVRDKQGLAVAGAEVHVSSAQLAIDRSALASWSAPQAPAASPMQSEPATARLIVQSSREMSGKPVRLALALQGQSEGAVVTITGLVPGMELSNGDPIGAAAWRLTATDLDDIWIGPPDGFVGSIDLVAELRLPDDEVVDRQTVRLEWLPSVSPAFAQWQRDREDIMPQQRKSASPSFAPSMPTRRSFTGNRLERTW